MAGDWTRRTATAWAARARAAGWIASLAFLLAAPLAQAGELRGDANCDGRVDTADLDAVLA